MKRISTLLVMIFVFGVAVFAEPTSVVQVNATVSGRLSITMATPDSFEVVDGSGDLIPTRTIGNTVIISNYAGWQIFIDSTYESSPTQGRLKLNGGSSYIPYTFELKDGATTLLSQECLATDHDRYRKDVDPRVQLCR
jgi:hypothetical protein